MHYLFQTSGEEEALEEDEEIEEDRKEEGEMQKSPDPPAIPLVGPIDLPALQSLSLSSSSFICEMPNCGAVRVFGIFNGGGCCILVNCDFGNQGFRLFLTSDIS